MAEDVFRTERPDALVAVFAPEQPLKFIYTGF
jgi:hypothetical protein